MKIIDLLNKIANREENLPKKIEILGFVYELKHSTHMPNYWRVYFEAGEENVEIAIDEDISIIQCLTDEVEILEEEKKIPEKLKLQIHHSNLSNLTLHEEQLEKNDNTLVDCFEEVEKKFNEIIDYLKSKGDE